MASPCVADNRIRVLVVDDHPLMRAGAEAIIRREGDIAVCGQAATVAEAIDLAVRTRPDVILLDLRLDGTLQDGVDLARVLVGLVPESGVLVHSGYVVPRSVSELIRIGVAGYVPKTVRPDALVLAIRTVAAGGQVFTHEVTEQISHPGQSDDPRSRRTGPNSLTAREAEAIQLVAEGLDNAQLARRLSLSPSSVRLCLTSAYAKLGARNRLEAVINAQRAGLILID